ncbi:Uncharacterized protein Fot_00343 [Forsythia ovata]|uniref:Uncharacterized protein n=1 Tax=Forsythia ovata TaxID=205694 RepID=A0ABD1X131_9LAMI
MGMERAREGFEARVEFNCEEEDFIIGMLQGDPCELYHAVSNELKKGGNLPGHRGLISENQPGITEEIHSDRSAAALPPLLTPYPHKEYPSLPPPPAVSSRAIHYQTRSEPPLPMSGSVRSLSISNEGSEVKG